MNIHHSQLLSRYTMPALQFAGNNFGARPPCLPVYLSAGRQPGFKILSQPHCSGVTGGIKGGLNTVQFLNNWTRGKIPSKISTHLIQEKVYNPLPFFILFSNFNQLNTNYQSFIRHVKPKSGTNSTGPY